MRVHLINNGYALSAKFPMTAFEMQDALDRLKYPVGNSEVTFRIYEFKNMNLPSELYEKDFSTDIYRLNLFAERLKNLEFTEIVAFKSLIVENPESSFEDMLLMTYGLDSVIVYPCGNCCELGETVIENKLVPEIEICSDEILELLDREKVGKLMCEREGGQFIDGCYCLTSGYNPPDIEIKIGRPENSFFRLLIALVNQNYGSARWISLPFDDENQNMNFDGMTCVKSESSLPNLSKNQFQTEKINGLNDLAKSLSELSHDDFVKLKAVMESEKINEISDVKECVDRISEYQLDRNIADSSEFGRAYLLENLHENFDCSAVGDMNLCDFGQLIIDQKHGKITSYGAVLGRGQELYSVLVSQPEQSSSEEHVDDECEEMEVFMS
ncbi:MAG: hypothetical protein NC177_16870 [Ruminococcus flavefaciens]|nr:hypothetical protein [Ruminococcus flavefaciens]